MRRLLLTSLFLASLAAPAWAQVESREGLALQNQILELKRDIQALKSQMGLQPQSGGSLLGGSVPRPSVAAQAGSAEIAPQLLDRLTTLEDNTRRLNGRIDELENTMRTQHADLQKQIGDLQFRLDNPGAAPKPGAPAAQAQQSPPPGALGQAPGAAPKRTPELMLQEGNAALARRDYTLAESTAREALKASAGSPRAYDAQFLLAQALNGQRNYAQAAVAYGDTFERNKQGQHAQDALIGLSANLVALNEKKSACAALDTLRAQFPTPRADVASRAATIRAQAGCR